MVCGQGDVNKFFFFKRKTAYEIRLGLVGSEICIRERMYRRSVGNQVT